MKTTRNTFLASLLVGVMMLGSACTAPSVSNTVVALNAVADAASVAVVVAASLSASNTITPADAAAVSTYAQAISAATTKSIAELNSTTDTNTTKITVITEAFVLVAAPAFGPNTSPQIVAVTNAVGTAIQLFLNQLHASGTLKLAKLAPHATIVLEKGDKAKLKAIKAKTAETLVKAKALVKK